MFLSLQTLRFFAATSVVLFHTIYYAVALHVLPREQIGEAPAILSSGVTVFFALSGFLMAKMSAVSGPIRFLSHKLLRIYPPFFAAVAMTVVAKLIIWGSFPPFDAAVVLTLIPPGRQMQYPLGVEWTLIYEVFFYLVVTVLCILPTVAMRKVFICGWAFTIIVVNELLDRSVTAMLPSPGQIAFSYLNLAFIAGMAGWWLRDIVDRYAIPLLIAGIALIVLAHVDHHGVTRNFAPPLGAALLVVGTATRRLSTIFSRRSALVILGDGSYGIYLLHVPIITIIFARSGAQGFGIALVSIAAAILIGAAFGLAEFNLYRMIVRRWSSPALPGDGELRSSLPARS